MKLNELVAEFAAVDSQLEVLEITSDSREVKPGYVFIALADEVQQGLKHIQQALALGAAAVICAFGRPDTEELAMFNAVEWITIAGLNLKLAELAARYYNYPAQRLEIIGVTGTNGKTSCSQFLAQILTDAMVIGTLGWGTWGNVQFTGYTTPNPLVLQKILAQAVAVGKKTVVMEVSSHGVQENRIGQTTFKGAVFTNLSHDHLDYHGSMEAYFLAKLQLFKRPELEFAVINQDDAYSERIISAIAPSVVLWTFTQQEKPNSARCVQAKNSYCSGNGIQFEVCCGGETALVDSQLYGEFNIENMLAVLTTLLAMGVSLQEAASKVSALKPVIGRMEHFGGNDQPSIFVDFAHTPDALEKALLSLKKHTTQQIVLVFGCGGNRDRDKRALMGRCAGELADKIIITDDNPRFEDGDELVADILIGCKNPHVTVIRDRALAIKTAISQAVSGDCILIAGKGHENYQEVKGVKTPFSDQEVVKKILQVWTK